MTVSKAAKKGIDETTINTEGELGDKINEIVKSGPYNQDKLSELLNCSQGTLSKRLRGDIAWKNSDLQKFCEIYDLDFVELLAGKNEIKISAQLGTEGFDFSKLGEESYGMTSMPDKLKYSSDRIYAIQLVGDDFVKPFKDGRILYAVRNSGEEAEDGDYVIFIDDENRGSLRLLTISENYIILKSQTISGQEVVRPISHKRLLDRIIWIKF